MKKLALLLAVGLLAACGGGGGGSSSTPAPYQANGATGTLVVNVKSSAKMLSPDVTTTDVTMRRIIVTNPDILNSAGKIVQFAYPDYDITTSPTITIPNIPVASGYTVELLEYKKSTTNFSSYTAVGYHQRTIPGTYSTIYTSRPGSSRLNTPFTITKYAFDTFAMPGTGTVSVTLVPATPTGSVALAAGSPYGTKIPSNANISYQNLSTLYKMQAVGLGTTSPFDTALWKLRQGYSNTPSALTATQSISGLTSATLVGPAAYDPNNAFYSNYFSAAEFNVKDTLLVGTEKSSDFVWVSGIVSNGLYTKTNSFGTPLPAP